MKIAIHPNINSFSERWIKYCEDQSLDYKIVNAFDSNVIEQLKDCDIFMWHHHHAQYKDVLTAKRILFALEHAGVKVFPDFNTGWHFDDKVAQKYLLEAINAPLVPSYVFYDKETALNWAKNTSYPKVFKLKGGAGASNVKLVRNYNKASKLISKSFNKGFQSFDNTYILKEKFKKFKSGKESFFNLIKYFFLSILNIYNNKLDIEKGYCYFQDFIPNNLFDLRIIIINQKAIGIKRIVRENDFRASGSGNIIYDQKEIDLECVKIAFEVNDKIKSQSTAFDFVFDTNGTPLIVEISYGFSMKAYDKCPGYWNKELKWINDDVNPQRWMIENILSTNKSQE